jgi:hypothetical protein
MMSLDPEALAPFLYEVLKKMQQDDQFAMRMQMELAAAAMGEQQAAAADQALEAVRMALTGDGQMVGDPATSLPPPGSDVPEANVPLDVSRDLERNAYPV